MSLEEKMATHRDSGGTALHWSASEQAVYSPESPPDYWTRIGMGPPVLVSCCESLPADAVRLVPDSRDGALDRWRQVGGALVGFLIVLGQERVQLSPRAEHARAIASNFLAEAWK